MPYSLIFHTQVEADVDEAYDWYDSQSIGLGERLLSELLICYKKLEDHPELFGKIVKNYRKIAMDNFPYIILYEIQDPRVVVYSFFHTSRDPKEITKRIKSFEA